MRLAALPDILLEATLGVKDLARLPAREDRDPDVPLFPIGSTDRLRTAIARACKDAGVPTFSPHDLRHRRISLLHHQGVSWAEIGARVGQRNISTTADVYSHVLLDGYHEINRSTLLTAGRTSDTASSRASVLEATSIGLGGDV